MIKDKPSGYSVNFEQSVPALVGVSTCEDLQELQDPSSPPTAECALIGVCDDHRFTDGIPIKDWLPLLGFLLLHLALGMCLDCWKDSSKLMIEELLGR